MFRVTKTRARKRGAASVGFDVPAVAQGTRGAGGPRGRDAEASVACVLHQRAWHRGPRTGASGVIVRGACTQAHELGPRPDGFRCACPASCRRNWSPCRQHDVIGTRSSVCVRFPEPVRRTSPARASTHLAGTEGVHCREAAIVRARTRARVAQSRRLDRSACGWSAAVADLLAGSIPIRRQWKLQVVGDFGAVRQGHGKARGDCLRNGVALSGAAKGSFSPRSPNPSRTMKEWVRCEWARATGTAQ